MNKRKITIHYPATLTLEANSLALFRLPKASGKFRCGGCKDTDFEIYLVKIAEDGAFLITALCKKPSCHTLHILTKEEK